MPATQTYKKNGRGFLSLNDKGDNENRPDYTGKVSLEIDESDLEVSEDGKVRVEFNVAAWNSESNAGNPYISIQVGNIAEDS